MKFILYSQFDERSIQDNLGRPDYDYYFALKAYLPVLMELGTVERVQHPETEVDAIFERCAAQGEPCVFMSFAPPHKTPTDLKCPTVPVIVWGFSNIPDEVWDDNPRNDWRFVLNKLGRAIALSSYAADAIAAALRPDFPVRAIAPPLAGRAIEPARQALANSGTGGIELTLRGVVIDSTAIGLSADLVGPSQRPEAVQDEPPPLVEPHDSMSPHPQNERSASPAPTAETQALTALDEAVPGTAPESDARVTLGGVVYTAVPNPLDADANWTDLMTAFCWAFRDIDDATLVLKMDHHDLVAYWTNLVQELSRLSPFKCRVVALHGHLGDSEYESLMTATSFYVNASNCEGWCRPLMEFLAAGRPAIAPAHTAMADYIDGEIAFVLRAAPELSAWPHDQRKLLRTTCYRLDWGSLVDAFRNSYRLAKDAPADYSAMAARARRRMQEVYSVPVVGRMLRGFLAEPYSSGAGTAGKLTVKGSAFVAAASLSDREMT